MKSAQRARYSATLAAIFAAGLALAACNTPAPPPPPPPPPAAPPPVAQTSRVIEAAAAYKAYMDKTAKISPDFKDGDQVAQSVRDAAGYETGGLQKGAAAYAAVAALQDAGFVANVRVYAVDPAQRRDMVAKIMADPTYVLGVKGADAAAGLAVAALDDAGAKVVTSGKAVKQAAYSVQHSAWSKADVPGRDARLALAKSLSGTMPPAAVDDSAKLQSATTGAPSSLGLTGAALPPPYTPTVVRGLAVAAIAALGEATDVNADNLMLLLADPGTEQCLRMAKLNLYQCLAVARPHYEDIFCLGQHEMIDTGQCIVKAAGAPKPVEAVAPPPPEKPVPAKKPTKKAAAKKKKK